MIRTGIDIGANSLRLVMEGEGIVFDEPCCVALDQKGNAIAIGNNALEMTNSEEVRVVMPFATHPIDFQAMDAMLELLCYEFKIFKLFRKTILLVSHPTALSIEETEKLKDHLLELGAWRVYFDQEIWISAIGAKLDIFLPIGSCVMNLGYSNCDIALFMKGKIVGRSCSPINGRTVRDAIRQWLINNHHLAVGDEVLDQIQRKLGCVKIQEDPLFMEIVGIDIKTRNLKKIQIDENQIVAVLSPIVREWGIWISQFVETLDRDWQEDVRIRGIVSCGGTMRLKGLADSLRVMTDCPIYVTDDPANTVAQGLEILMTRIDASQARA